MILFSISRPPTHLVLFNKCPKCGTLLVREPSKIIYSPEFAPDSTGCGTFQRTPVNCPLCLWRGEEEVLVENIL